MRRELKTKIFLRVWLAKLSGASKHHLQRHLNFLGLKLNSLEDWFEKPLCYNVSVWAKGLYMLTK
ncbi:hypothetical protein Halru_2413 [Halovivax ruber XH-70]|uniref:Uncharacterized protein n=1 Tax=Halovivax ruber (strain DSM 18193 / JCM 13892 / XH-70) TaxID=797302 RepID=L0IFJ8_HALRX|nr:hypothetical protein Halru_2413 [Halovivax ruber XH-70]